MAVALIESRLGAEEVHILLPFNVPYVHSLPSVDGYWDWLVIVCAERELSVYDVLRGGERGRDSTWGEPREGSEGLTGSNERVKAEDLTLDLTTDSTLIPPS